MTADFESASLGSIPSRTYFKKRFRVVFIYIIFDNIMYYLDQLTCILVNLERLADLGIVIEMNFLAISHVKLSLELNLCIKSIILHLLNSLG